MIDTTSNDAYVVTMPIDERYRVEIFRTMIIYFNNNGIDEYYDIVRALYGIGSYSYASKKLYLDLKNRTTLLDRSSIKEPFVLELKALLSCL